MAELKETHRYDDIIHRRRPVSVRHAPMTNSNRAAQFSPFAALTGYEEVIAEAARQTTSRIELEESELQLLDRKLQYLREKIPERPEITVTYFEPDTRKTGGAYRTVRGYVKKIDTYNRCIILTTQQRIPVEEILRIFCDES